VTHRITRLVPLFGLTLFLVGDPAAGSAHRTVATATIASATSSGFRAELVAHRASGGRAPTAAVTLTTLRRAGGTWQTLETKRLVGTFFWKTVSGPRAVCRFELASTNRPRVTVQLLQTPSLGCGKPTTVLLPRD
jgi:hypothetical protein